MASDSSSSTPLTLTPDSTGLPDATAIKKARRQTAFYPNVNSTNKPQKPFSRSAAKRESVMALGSIEHLQHYFTKTGIAAKNNPFNKPNSGFVPAIGGLSHIKSNASLSGLPAFQLPPSPAIPPVNRPSFPTVAKTYETNPSSLLPGVVEDLTAVAYAWGVDRDGTGFPATHDSPELLGASPKSNGNFDVLGTLKTTTRAVRSVRNYVLSLPDDRSELHHEGHHHQQFLSRSLTPAPKRRLVSQPNMPNDPLTLIRRSALEVLTVLRELEEKCRVPLSDDAYDAQSDHGSGSSPSPRARIASPSELGLEPEHEDTHPVDADTSISFSFVQVHGRYESVPVWEEEDADHLSEEEQEQREKWDERLVLGGGWLYKQDVRLQDLGREKDVVGRYLDVVDDALFGGVKDGRRGWQREKERAARREKAEREGRGKGRRVSAGDGEGRAAQFLPDEERKGRRVVSTGMLDAMAGMSVTEEPEEMETVGEDLAGERDEEESSSSVDDEDLPVWAQRRSFTEDPLGRAHALLASLLPASLLSALPPPPTSTSEDTTVAFLQGLSSGQLLCTAYNTGVRRSRKPWGYISTDAIHDIIALEEAAGGAVEKDEKEGGKKGWTFRRTDNLRLWAAALKLRYLLPVIAPPASITRSDSGTPLTSPLPSQSSLRFPTSEPPIFFDARVVARKDEGWERMLETALLKWAETVVEERRGDR